MRGYFHMKTERHKGTYRGEWAIFWCVKLGYGFLLTPRRFGEWFTREIAKPGDHSTIVIDGNLTICRCRVQFRTLMQIMDYWIRCTFWMTSSVRTSDPPLTLQLAFLTNYSTASVGSSKRLWRERRDGTDVFFPGEWIIGLSRTEYSLTLY